MANGRAPHDLLGERALAAEHAEFADLAHHERTVPGNGTHTIWPMLLGPNGGRYLLLTGQPLSAREALTPGVVGEVEPADALMPRAREVAHRPARQPRRTLCHTRSVLVRHLRRLREDLDIGLAVEALAMI